MLYHNSLSYQLIGRFSTHSVELLLRYPAWRMSVLEAFNLAPLPMNYDPTLIEAFDQQGLLAGRVNDLVYTVDLLSEHRSEFVAWYFDGELVFFATGSEVIINRLQLVSVAGLFDLKGN
jgi:hypothetical protein